METSSGESTPTTHRRTPSGRASRPRRSTRGPLDISQAPVSNTTTAPSAQTLAPSISLGPPVTLSTYTTASSGLPSSFSTYTSAPSYPVKEFPKLLRPEIYHPLTHLTTPAPFRSSSIQPNPEAPLVTLLATGHFRAAAIAAAQALTNSTSPTDYQAIFSLLYTRLACLTLCGSTTLAAQEATALEDLNSSIYRDENTGSHIVPWELRVLAVRLQGVGFNDPRKGIMGYYDLARQARAEITNLRAKGEADEQVERKLWEVRLEDLGLRVASALVEMEDLEGATRHLEMLSSSSYSVQYQYLGLQRAILWLRIGNLDAAKRCVSQDVSSAELVAALASMAEGQYDIAAEAWDELCLKKTNRGMYRQNQAVCLLYSGKMDEARAILEDLISEGSAFHALTFNLCTIYELCTDKSRTLKLNLAEQVASLSDTDGLGWEKSVVDFKL